MCVSMNGKFQDGVRGVTGNCCCGCAPGQEGGSELGDDEQWNFRDYAMQ